MTTVVVWWEEFLKRGDGYLRKYLVKEERNPNSRYAPGLMANLADLTRQANVPWTYLDALVREAIPGAADGSVTRC